MMNVSTNAFDAFTSDSLPRVVIRVPLFEPAVVG
jgi:hypothetical protein